MIFLLILQTQYQTVQGVRLTITCTHNSPECKDCLPIDHMIIDQDNWFYVKSIFSASKLSFTISFHLKPIKEFSKATLSHCYFVSQYSLPSFIKIYSLDKFTSTQNEEISFERQHAMKEELRIYNVEYLRFLQNICIRM